MRRPSNRLGRRVNVNQTGFPYSLESKAIPRQYGAFRLTTVKIELDWVPAPCEACRKTTVSEP